MPLWGKAIWWLGILASFVLGLFMLLPKVASFLVERQLEAFGCKHVNVVLEFPGLRQTVVPLVAFQKDVGAETARLTIKGLTLEYQLPQLIEGFVSDVRIEELHMDLTGGPPARAPQFPDEFSIVAAAGALDSLSEFLLDPRVGRLALTDASIFREQATGPFRRLKVSGSLRHEDGTLHGAGMFQGMKGEPYALQLTINPRSEMKVLLHSGQGPAESLLDVTSTVRVSNRTGFHWHGSLRANLKRSTPFLALLLPLGPDLERVDGVVEFRGEGATKQTGSFHRMLRDASTHLQGVFHASVELPAWGESSQEIAMTLSGEMNADSTRVAVTLFPYSSVKGLVHLPESLLRGTPFPIQKKEPVRLQVQDAVKARVSWDNDPRWTIDGPIRIQYGVERSPVGLDAVVTNASGLLRDPLSTKADVHGRLWGRLPVLESQSVQTKDLRWNVTGKLAFQRQAIHAEVAKGSWIKTGSLQFEQGTANAAELHVGRILPVFLALPSKKWKVGATTAHVTDPRLHWGDQTVSMESVELRLKEAGGERKKWQTKGSVHVTRPRIHWGGHTVTIERVGLRFDEARGEGKKWQAKGMAKGLGLSSVPGKFVPPQTNLAIGFDATSAMVRAGIVAETVDQFVKVTGRITHDLTTNQGAFRATLESRPFSQSGTTLSRWITPGRTRLMSSQAGWVYP